jgi:hypothetical protein
VGLIGRKGVCDLLGKCGDLGTGAIDNDEFTIIVVDLEWALARRA